MTDYNDLPLEHPAGHSLPMSLLADGVAARHGRRADDEESEHRSGDGPAYRGHGAQGSSGAGAARAGGSIRLIDVDSKVTQSPAGQKGGGIMDPKELELINALAEAYRNCVEADRKWAEAYRELQKYQKSKAQQGGKAGE